MKNAILRADLHIHTTASDSCWTPEEVAAGVQAEGIGLFAITDHDTTVSVAPAEALARAAGLAFLRGVEVSALEDGALLHILGYGIEPDDPGLQALFAENEAKMRAVDEDDIRALIALGYPLTLDDYARYTFDRRRGGFKSLNYLIDRGVCTDPRDFFDRIRAVLHHQWPAFPHPAEVTARIRAAGGLPVLAHPGASLKPFGGVTEATLDRMATHGIAGVECYSQYHDAATTALCVAWCERRGLLITGGSDYHGGFIGRQLGMPWVDTAMLRLGPLTDFVLWP